MGVAGVAARQCACAETGIEFADTAFEIAEFSCCVVVDSDMSDKVKEEDSEKRVRPSKKLKYLKVR